MQNIKKEFDNGFLHWKITLPSEALETQQSGEIFMAGWHVQYQFGKNEHGQFLDYYASHRMTDDSHVRIYESGESESLPSMQSFYFSSEDATEEEKQKAEQEYYAYNRKIQEELKRKGFS
ncbi:hypothetical protein [Nostoc sp.]|uniref:hypothetical protein n=1 Tax=Nostoc sp. TaxID=1180 RepID=UPI002FF45493